MAYDARVMSRAPSIFAALSSIAVTLAAVPAAASFPKGPYLQGLGTTGVTIKFELPSEGNAKVEILGPGKPEPVATQETKEARFFHAVRFDGLAPGTDYTYRVTPIAGGAAEGGRFTTAPKGDMPFRFLAYGDSRSDPASHAAVVAQMLKRPSDFLVNTGDMVATGKNDQDWREFFAVERDLLRDRCAFAAVGNHELTRGDPAGEVAFLRYFAAFEGGAEVKKLYGSFRWGNTRFFLLNAMDDWTGDERAWLTAELDKAKDEPGLLHRFAVLHHGPFSSGPHGANRRLREGGVIDIMRDRKVDLVLAGHDHVYERGAGSGLKYVVTGGSGAPLYNRERAASETITFEPVHHFIEVAVEGPKVTLTARRAIGSVIETCGFAGDGAWECEGKPGGAAPQGTSPPSTQSPVQRAACSCRLAEEEGEGSDGGWLGGAFAMMACLAGMARRRRGARQGPYSRTA